MMTPEERDRLVTLEAQVVFLSRQLSAHEQQMTAHIAEINKKVDLLIDTLKAGKIAWRTVVIIGSFVIAAISAVHWVYGVISNLVRP